MAGLRRVLALGVPSGVLLLALSGCEGRNSTGPVGIVDDPVGAFGTPRALTGGETLAEATASGTPGIALDRGRIQYFVGYAQRTGHRDPVVLRYEDGVLDWARSDYETSDLDGEAYGLYWAGSGEFFVAFSSVGPAAAPQDDYASFTGSGWLPEYGAGGGAQVSVLARLRETDGSPREATYLRAESAGDDAADLRIVELSLLENDLVQIDADTGLSPLDTDRTRLVCSVAPPIRYRLVLTNDLSTAVSAQGTGCT